MVNFGLQQLRQCLLIEELVELMRHQLILLHSELDLLLDDHSTRLLKIVLNLKDLLLTLLNKLRDFIHKFLVVFLHFLLLLLSEEFL